MDLHRDQRMGGLRNQWIGLRENFNRTAPYFMGKSMVSGSNFPLNQSVEEKDVWNGMGFLETRQELQKMPEKPSKGVEVERDSEAAEPAEPEKVRVGWTRWKSRR